MLWTSMHMNTHRHDTCACMHFHTYRFVCARTRGVACPCVSLHTQTHTHTHTYTRKKRVQQPARAVSLQYDHSTYRPVQIATRSQYTTYMATRQNKVRVSFVASTERCRTIFVWLPQLSLHHRTHGRIHSYTHTHTLSLCLSLISHLTFHTSHRCVSCHLQQDHPR